MGEPKNLTASGRVTGSKMEQHRLCLHGTYWHGHDEVSMVFSRLWGWLSADSDVDERAGSTGRVRDDRSVDFPEPAPKAKRVIDIVRRHDGRFPQVELVEETGWSKATVSRVLSEMEQEGQIRKIRVGRGNVVTLPGYEPEWYEPPDAPLGTDPLNASARRDILLVEDEPAAARLLREAFREAGVTNPVHVVRDGLDAVDFLKQRGRYSHSPRPGLVILDLDLLVVDGTDVLVEFDEMSTLSGLPVLILSQSSDPGNVRTAYDLGATAYLEKPTEFEDLVALAESIADFWLRHTVPPPPIASGSLGG